MGQRALLEDLRQATDAAMLRCTLRLQTTAKKNTLVLKETEATLPVQRRACRARVDSECDEESRRMTEQETRQSWHGHKREGTRHPETDNPPSSKLFGHTTDDTQEMRIWSGGDHRDFDETVSM